MKSKMSIDEYGRRNWKLPNGKTHREDGPALEWYDGDKSWYLNGERHREDSPAVEWNDGRKEWWVNDIKYTEQEHKHKMRSKN
jgi:hypothetical protein